MQRMPFGWRAAAKDLAAALLLKRNKLVGGTYEVIIHIFGLRQKLGRFRVYAWIIAKSRL